MSTQFDICMIVHNDLIHDGRVLKEATSLTQQGWKVAVLGISLGDEIYPEHEEFNGFTIYRVTPKLFRNLFPGRLGLLLPLIPMLPAMSIQLRKIKARMYHAHDFPALLQIRMTWLSRPAFIYDSHELFFDRPLPDLPRPIEWLIKSMKLLEKPFAKRAEALITVNDSIAEILSNKLSISRSIVLRNAVDTRALMPSERTFPVSDDKKIIVHTGRLASGRHLPELVEALQYLPENYVIVFLGDGPMKPQLESAADAVNVSHRVIYVDPVSPYAVSSTISQADVAIVVTTKQGKNNELSLPNKLFEAVAAGLPMVTSSNKEIAALIADYDMGYVCDASDPKSIAQGIEEILGEKYDTYKQNAIRAQQELNWEHEERKLIDLYDALLNPATHD